MIFYVSLAYGFFSNSRWSIHLKYFGINSLLQIMTSFLSTSMLEDAATMVTSMFHSLFTYFIIDKHQKLCMNCSNRNWFGADVGDLSTHQIAYNGMCEN